MLSGYYEFFSFDRGVIVERLRKQAKQKADSINCPPLNCKRQMRQRNIRHRYRLVLRFRQLSIYGDLQDP